MAVAGGSSSPLTGISVSKACSGLSCAPDGLVSSSNCVTQVVAMVSGALMCVCFPRTTTNIYPTPQTLPTRRLSPTHRGCGDKVPNHLSAASDFILAMMIGPILLQTGCFWGPANLRAWLGDSGSIASTILAALWLWTDGGC